MELRGEVRDGRIGGGLEANCAHYLVYTGNVYVNGNFIIKKNEFLEQKCIKESATSS